jgi:hypothetical protein
MNHRSGWKIRVFTTWLIGVLSATIGHLAAAEVYRSVDAEGNVTYTDSPMAGDKSAEKVELPPGPSPDAIKESEVRHQEIRRAADQAERKRLGEEKNENEPVSQARKALAEAEAKLADAKVIKDEDRQNLAGGRRRISPDYFDRLKAAEAAVESARKHLREVRGY